MGTFATFSAVGSALLMFHFLRCLMQTTTTDPVPGSPIGLMRLWLLMAFSAVVVPWVLYPTAESGGLLAAVAPTSLWAALWPVLIGAALAVALWRWGDRLPWVPEGDIVVAGGTAMRAAVTCGEAVERADLWLRRGGCRDGSVGRVAAVRA